ncbi:cytidylate kinase [Desulfuromusa kysingii]|uniref:Cytidylate kinase n=1 Tax=Desulfuromusa kysingii TaxID=37625 RepID=A0A1H3YCT6_9BACT|nr:(d)CMP kinase [Desulfuromusa kysingii]SEA09425.1 cytidylate kinase [Desulfuromusa kysingii]
MLKEKLIIAIDGPSGAGKSTLSKALAKQFDYLNIDTGAMYRSVALLVQQQGIALDDEGALQELCKDLSIRFIRHQDSEQVIVNGVDVSAQIRTPEVSLLTAKVAASQVVREAMVKQQREMGAEGGVVLEGRDIGTVVFPDAEVKFFLQATAEERGRRRYEELMAKGSDVNLEQTIIEVKARDAADMARTHAPLTQAEDAVVIDSTRLSIAEVLDEMSTIVRKKQTDKRE